MKYPENERILIVRPCLKAICLGVRSASKLLSVMLYRARHCAEKETTFTFTCNQDDLVHDLCEELTTKQIHDMAIPVLQLLGYLEVDGSGFRHIYTVHLDKVQLALSCYKNTEELELLLISFIYKQLEEVPMELELVPIQLEEVLKHLELLLKQIRTSSNSKRGRKPRREALLEAHSENADSNRESRDITDKERAASLDALTPADFLPENNTHSHSGHNAWNCEAWCNAHDGATCTDYQAYIDSGQREEADTEPRITAVNSEIGATDDNPTLAHHRTLLVREHHNQTADHPAQDLAIGATDGNVTTRDHSGTGISDRSPARGSLLKAQSPAGNPNGTTHTQQPTQVAIASTPGEPDSPPALSRQLHTTPSLSEPDGAATALENSGPRASGKQLPLSLKEDEPVVRPETPAQREKRIEQRKKEIWALVEQKLETKFTRTQRLSQANVAGMENLIEDETDDETIKTALDRLDNFYRAQFNLKQFHLLIPGLFAAKAPSSATNGKAASSAGLPAFLQPTSSMRSINGLSMKGTQD